MRINSSIKRVIFFILFITCMTPYVDAPLALILGFLMTLLFGNPYSEKSSKSVSWLLKFAIIGLGFGMNFFNAMEAGKTGMLFTVATIILVLCLGWLLGKLLSLNNKTTYLVSSGTAICGGSAIAAIAPIIKADSKQISVALGSVFVLNAIALLIFPIIGNYFDLSQSAFGLWSAIAIHDTSSVVGAASKYGAEALEIATTVKLGRALWIIPLSLITVLFYKGNSSKIKIPYFIGLFILTMLISTFLPQFEDVYAVIVVIAKRALIVTLFLIGTGLSIRTIKSVGYKTFLLSSILWIAISITSLIVILNFYT